MWFKQVTLNYFVSAALSVFGMLFSILGEDIIIIKIPEWIREKVLCACTLKK